MLHPLFIYIDMRGFFWWGCQKFDGLSRTKREHQKSQPKSCQKIDMSKYWQPGRNKTRTFDLSMSKIWQVT